MAKTNEYKSSSTELSTILGPDAEFEGKLSVKQSMRIDGKVQGEIACSETVTIGTGGKIDGDVSAKDLVIGGKITGKVTATGRTRLEKTSVLNGDLKTMRLIVEEGAVFNGNSDMGGGDAQPLHQPRKIKLFEDKKEE